MNRPMVQSAVEGSVGHAIGEIIQHPLLPPDLVITQAECENGASFHIDYQPVPVGRR